MLKVLNRKSTTKGNGEDHGSTAGGAKRVSPRRTPLLQSLLVLAGALLVSWLVLTLLVAPAEQASHEQAAEEHITLLQQRFNQHLGYIHTLVSAYGTQTIAFTDGADSDNDEAERILRQALPATRELFLFAGNQITQPLEREFQLGFASIDLARRARSGETHMDAFRRDNQWLIQVATPVQGADESEPRGILLVVFAAEVLDPIMAASGLPAGEVVLSQQVEGRPQAILRTGQGQGESLRRNLDIAGWQISFSPARESVTLFPRSLLWGLPLLVALLVIAGLWWLYGLQQRLLDRDCARLSEWARKSLAGERSRLPVLSSNMLSALAESLDRLTYSVERRHGKSQGGKVKPGRNNRAQDPGQKNKSSEQQEPEGEPLFDDSQELDIDMLDGDDDVLGLGREEDDSMQIKETAPVGVAVPASIFRAYDIRGVVGESLTSDTVRTIGQAIGSEARQRQQSSICVGYDGRHSGPELAEALMQGIMAAGVDVIDVGRVPTPVLYFAAHHLQTGSGVMVTGSHNPPDYNGLKMVLGGETLAGDAIQELLARIRQQRLEQGQGQRTAKDVRGAYLETIINDIAVAAPLKVVLDAGNGIAGELGPKLVKELGCEVIPLYCEVDGNFPNHHPDPGKPENLTDLIAAVKEHKADLGIAFDGDGDRIGVVTESGKIIWPDRLLMLFARDVVSRNPGADIIYDVKCSRRLATVINEFGGRPVMWKTGHSWIKAKMKTMGALLAGEMSGHIFFKERWYGFDDGLYAAARLLEILGSEERGADAVFADFPEDFSTPEINLQVTDENKFSIIESLARDANFGNANITDIDGLRVDYPDGWGLVRASNTTPMLVLRFESETEAGLERIKAVFREQMSRIQPDLDITF
ncbi:MAG: phosphomannomutase/phosphoglucomutase [Halomonadaceae bacterium]|nr:MAG: phosphomannomutase/phosphoglucomutase [Halomonadaceae bacterium]